jgi:glutamate 5-kinase
MKKRLVLKFGTGILTTDASGLQLDRSQFARLSAEIAALVDGGHEVIVISSAAEDSVSSADAINRIVAGTTD